MNPFKVFQVAVRAVPQIKYALGVAGIVAVVAIVQAFRLDFKVAVFGTIIIFVGMGVLLVFARATTTAPKHFLRPVLFLTWASLVLLIASAFLLFSAVFFAKPQGFHDWLFGHEPPVKGTSQRSPTEFIKAAEMQRAGGDYEGAWKQIEEALRVNADSKEARDLQVRIAMEWLRNIRIVKRTGKETFTEIIDRILPPLYRAAIGATGVPGADIHAHIGWGNFLKYKEAIRGLKIEEEYQQALKFDPNNPYAHAMWGYWFLYRDDKLKDATEHFAAALRSGRDRKSVRQFQMLALMNCQEAPCELEKIRVTNEMRQNSEDLDSDMRSRIKSRVYFPFRAEVIDQIRSILSPADHLATYIWLAQGSDNDSIHDRLWVARLTEETGEFSKALSAYRSIQSDRDFKRFRFQEEVESGIARCTQKLPNQKAQLQLLLEAAKNKEPAIRERAIRGLPRIGSEVKDILPAITVATQDQNQDVRAAAWDALMELRAAALPALIEFLASNEERDILNATAGLQRMGSEAAAGIPSLIKLLQNQSAKTRLTAARAIGAIGSEAKAAVPALIAMVKAEANRDLREGAAYALGEVGPNAKEAVPVLTKMLKDRDGEEGYRGCAAAEALGKIGSASKEAVPALAEALEAYDEIRLPGYAAEALGRIGAEAKAAVPQLIQAMKDVEKDHKKYRAEPLSIIATTLGDKGDVEAIPLLRQVLKAFEEENFEPKIISPVREALESLKEKRGSRK